MDWELDVEICLYISGVEVKMARGDCATLDVAGDNPEAGVTPGWVLALTLDIKWAIGLA
jgi:hypothetical protein